MVFIIFAAMAYWILTDRQIEQQKKLGALKGLDNNTLHKFIDQFSTRRKVNIGDQYPDNNVYIDVDNIYTQKK